MFPEVWQSDDSFFLIRVCSQSEPEKRWFCQRFALTGGFVQRPRHLVYTPVMSGASMGRKTTCHTGREEGCNGKHKKELWIVFFFEFWVVWISVFFLGLPDVVGGVSAREIFLQFMCFFQDDFWHYILGLHLAAVFYPEGTHVLSVSFS